eukprot:CAMPEP_0171654666 /NCGR_PEP_ID=MMETSP0990-20121206/40372_1 /TAXON_ID=483369 /ORGANISM="non described non described, Strain CCMP2098" /LENGTH=148 /DNA_ID=CAMNT_0012234493 /DNA_START=293 /DNA_END=739 /DNA_ORIENTATION=+
MDIWNKNMKKEITDFSSFYLSQKNSGPGINAIRTDVSLLATHYTNSGFAYPVKPDMQQRLLGSLKDVEDLLVKSQAAVASAPEQSEGGAGSVDVYGKVAREKLGEADGGGGLVQPPATKGSEKESAMQMRLLQNNPEAFKEGGFKTKT